MLGGTSDKLDSLRGEALKSAPGGIEAVQSLNRANQ
jgi:hypothetical protein